MRPRALWILALLAVAGLARADDPVPAAPVCAAARDPQLVVPDGSKGNNGILHVLDRAGSSIQRWSLATRAALSPLTVAANAVAFAYLPARNALVIAHASPARLTLRPFGPGATEQAFAAFDATTDGELCGLASSGDFVIACVDHTHYVVFDPMGTPGSNVRVGTVPDTTHSWDGMVWVDATRTLYATRKQGAIRTAIALHLDESGNLGPAEIVPFIGGHADLDDEFPVLLPDGSRILTPDGSIVGTVPLSTAAQPAVATGEAFAAGNSVFFVGASLTAGCALASADVVLSSHALLTGDLVRGVSWQGRSWLLRGSGATAALSVVKPGSGDLDFDRSPDARDFFPLDPVKARDWDRDGVDDKHDALPTDPSDWQDTDGDGVGDIADTFPNDPKEWKDSDGDGVGDNADACDDDPEGSVDSDSDGACEDTDDLPNDPLWTTDTDGDGIGDGGDAFPNDPNQWIAPFTGVTEVFDVTVKRAVNLWGFAPTTTTTPMFLVLYEGGRFALQSLDSTVLLPGTFQSKGASGKKLVLQFDPGSLSLLEPQFADAATAIVDSASPPVALDFVPKSVISDGVAQLTKKGVTLSLRVRFAFKRDTVMSPGSRGSFIYRATGPAEPQ